MLKENRKSYFREKLKCSQRKSMVKGYCYNINKKSSTRQQTQTYAGHFFVMSGLSLNLSIKITIFPFVFFVFVFYCIISVSVAGITILVFCEGLALRSHFDSPWQDIQPTVKMSPSYWMGLCSFVCSLLRLRLLLLLMRRWRRRGALALWLQCLFIITPWPAASSLFRHFILKMSRSNLKVTAHIGVQDTTLNRSCSQTISRRSGVWVLKTVLSFSAKQFLIFWRLSLCELTPAKYVVFFH